MDTDEAVKVSVEIEGTVVDTQKSCAYLKNAICYSYARGYTLECDRAFRKPDDHLYNDQDFMELM